MTLLIIKRSNFAAKELGRIRIGLKEVMNANLAAAGRSSAHLRLGRSSFEIPRCSTVTILLQGLDGQDIVGGVTRLRSAAERYLLKVGGDEGNNDNKIRVTSPAPDDALHLC